jgi:hypothetical protein
MTNRSRLLLIRGLGHSGTTILDLALGAHPDIIGLGEAVRILQRPRADELERGPAQLRGILRFRRHCTCGALASECPVWGPVLEWLPDHDRQTLEVKLQHLLEVLKTVGQPQWVVDSYQDDRYLPFWDEVDVDIRVIHLTRDVRSWVHSRSRKERQQGRPLPELRPLLRWWHLNARDEQRFARLGDRMFRLGYEELALQPESTLRRLCDWLELPFSPAMLEPGSCSASHVLSGNRMRFDPTLRKKIQYDSTWIQGKPGLAHLALCHPGLSGLNRRLVYSADVLSG